MTDLILETGKVQARDGSEARIYATDAGGDYPVHGARRCGDDLEALAEAARRQADRYRANAKCTQAFQYLNGDITKVEESSNAD